MLNYLLYYQLINTHHITSKTLTGIKVSHAVSLQVASLARSTLNAFGCGDPSQTIYTSTNYACFLRVVLLYTNWMCRTTQKRRKRV